MNKMKDINILINGLNDSPTVLKNFVNDIPDDKFKIRKINNKWTIHEHICHLTQAEEMIYERFFAFQTMLNPSFSAYIPGITIETNSLINLDIDIELINFKTRRNQTVELIRGFDADVWMRKANHEEYTEYGAYIFLRHVAMHDYFHMYRIEELWLTKNEFLNNK